jgi:sterol desaturase/sphingolipid hydroxylase (fatty acid hydroxylase superfamily)
MAILTFSLSPVSTWLLPPGFALNVSLNHVLHALLVLNVYLPLCGRGLSDDSGHPGFARYLVELGAFFVVYDVIFYALHRLLHTRALYAVHAQHHALRATNGLSGFYMSVADMVLEIALPLWMTLALVNPHWVSAYAILVLCAMNSVYSHAGVQLRGFSSPRNHAVHHIMPRFNYGIGLVDSLVGTSAPRVVIGVESAPATADAQEACCHFHGV